MRRLFAVIAILLGAIPLHAEQLKPETAVAFDRYTKLTEQRMAEQGPATLLRSSDADAERKLKNGEVIVDRIETKDNGRTIPVPGGLIHHWVGTVFIPGAALAQTVSFLQDYDNQAKYYAPDVERSRLMQRDGNNFKVYLRLRYKKVVTVVLNTDYDVTYTSFGSARAACRSISTRIAQVESPGGKNESEKPVGDDNGFLWRLNSYWRFEQRDGGTYVQLEAISLTRDIPTGLGWLIGPFVTSIPKESLEFTLNHTRQALLNKH